MACGSLDATQAAEGAAWAAGEGGGGTGAMDGCGGTRDRAKVCMGGPGHVVQPRMLKGVMTCQ